MSAPAWKHWDSQEGAEKFRGREITVFQPPRGSNDFSSVYRDSYPAPPLYWKHKQAKNHLERPVPSFEGTTSYREAFVPYQATGGPARRVPPEPKYQPKFQSLTTQREGYKEPPLPPRRPRTVPTFLARAEGSIGTTTMRADYVQHPDAVRVPRALPPDSIRPSKFYGMTTTRADYLFPVGGAGPLPKTKRPEHIVPSFEGTTTYRESYVPITLDTTMPADFGLQVATRPYKSGGVGGQFLPMILKGMAIPAEAQKVFTTVVDGQAAAAIVVVAKRPEMPYGLVLGHFDLGGIKPASVGVPKVEVKFRQGDAKSLYVSATYKNGPKSRSLTFQAERRGPNLRNVSTTDDIPQGD